MEEYIYGYNWVTIFQEPGAKDLETVRSYMLEYLADGSRSYSEPYFTVSEVVYSEISKYVVVVLLVASKDLCGQLVILSREYVRRLVLNKLNRVRSQVTN